MYKKILIIAAVAIALITGFYFVFVNNSKDKDSQAMVQGVTAQAEPQEYPPVKTSNIEPKLNEVINKYPGLNIGVSVNSISTDNQANIGKDKQFIAASTTKVIIAAYTYAQAEQNKINLDSILVPKKEKPADYQPVSFKENIRRMIVNSDNESWRDLKDYFGYSKIDAYTKQLGVASFKSIDNVISANDMSYYLKLLAQGKLINNQNSSELSGYMQKSWTGPLILDEQFQSLVKKTGWLEDRMHFVGLIGEGENKKSFAIYVETTDGKVIDYDVSTALINDLLAVIQQEAV